MNMKMFKGVIVAALIFIIYQKDLNSYTVEEIVNMSHLTALISKINKG